MDKDIQLLLNSILGDLFIFNIDGEGNQTSSDALYVHLLFYHLIMNNPIGITLPTDVYNIRLYTIYNMRI